MTTETTVRMTLCEKWIALCESGQVLAEQDTFGNAGPIRIRSKDTGELLGTISMSFDSFPPRYVVFFAAMECSDFETMDEHGGSMFEAAEKLLGDSISHAANTVRSIITR